MLAEQMPRAGMKLLASGGGRANLTKMLGRAEIENAFGRQGRFMGPALNALGPTALREFLARLGVKTVMDDQRRVYPASQRAADVLSALQRRLMQLGVMTHLNCLVSRLIVEDGKIAGVETSDGRIQARRVLLACGGKSWPKLGGSGGGYALAHQAGHTIIEPTAALVPLVTQERWVENVPGVSLSKARLRIALPKQSRAGTAGDILFTHRGLSGPAVIDLSGSVSQLLLRVDSVPIRIELIDGMDVACWKGEMESWRVTDGKRLVVKMLRQKLPASLA
ncbi:MAG TPA: aminoacetone oxidase family FAD-binding enzyme, partial [Phycisphaerae bacterium]|nr:aminoacetone oxidase family FAD-binding enzyme [Phycisphaerae bacterium]